jgi:hypothetical protein
MSTGRFNSDAELCLWSLGVCEQQLLIKICLRKTGSAYLQMVHILQQLDVGHLWLMLLSIQSKVKCQKK